MSMAQLRPPEHVIPFRPRGGGEPWVTKARIAEYFQVSGRTVERWKQRGMPFHRLGGTVRFRISEVESWWLKGALSGR